MAEPARRMQSALNSDMHPLLKDRLLKPRTVFYPGNRIKMNAVPMVLNLFIPWGMFVFFTGLSGFKAMYFYPGLVWVIFGAVLVLWLVTVYVAIQARRTNPEPTWFTYIAFTTGFFAVAGLIVGSCIFNWYTKPYLELKDLKVAGNIDATREYGENLMDAGILGFKTGNQLDPARSWHFKKKDLYCVAPVITDAAPPQTQSYDFWAVGKDCCSIGSSDFRCGAWGNSNARGGVRIIDDGDLAYYRLAVQQAEAVYDITAKHPIFITWSDAPFLEVESLNSRAFTAVLEWDCFAFITSAFFLSVAVALYAWIGRGAASKQILNGDESVEGPELKTYNTA